MIVRHNWLYNLGEWGQPWLEMEIVVQKEREFWSCISIYNLLNNFCTVMYLGYSTGPCGDLQRYFGKYWLLTGRDFTEDRCWHRKFQLQIKIIPFWFDIIPFLGLWKTSSKVTIRCMVLTLRKVLFFRNNYDTIICGNDHIKFFNSSKVGPSRGIIDWIRFLQLTGAAAHQNFEEHVCHCHGAGHHPWWLSTPHTSPPLYNNWIKLFRAIIPP